MSNLIVSPEPGLQVGSFRSKQLHGANFPDHPAWATAAQAMFCSQNRGGMSMKNVVIFSSFHKFFRPLLSNLSLSLILLQRQGESIRRKQAIN